MNSLTLIKYANQNTRLPSDFYGRSRGYSFSSSEQTSRSSTGSSDVSSLHRTSSAASDTSTSASSITSTPTRKRLHRRTVSGSSFQLPRAFQSVHKKTQPHSHSKSLTPLPPPPPPPATPQQRPRQPPLRPRRPSEEALRLRAEEAARLRAEEAARLRAEEAVQLRLKEATRLRSKEATQSRSKEAVVKLPTIRPLATQWQCSDLVVRCKDNVYQVDRVIMCYHSKWFARICAIMKTPVSPVILNFT
jgi:hypothetical protein